MFSFFVRNDIRTNLGRIAILFMLAGACNMLWFPALYEHRETVRFVIAVNLNYVGYIALLVWTSMAGVSLYLIYIGWRIRRLLLSREKITQSSWQFMAFQSAVNLLCVGVIADLGSLLLLRFTAFDNEAGSSTIVMSIFMGLRILQANLMAIQAYHQK